MALAANALATFAEAKARFGYLDDEQTVVEDLINSASSMMDAFCRRKLKARDSTIYLEGTDSDTIAVPEYPINAVTKLAIDGNRAFGSDTELASTEFSIKAEEGLIVLYSGVFSSRGLPDVVKVVHNVGYATTHLSYPILRSACLEYVDWLKSRYSRPGSIGRKGEYSADRISVSFETDMPLHIKSMLGSFVRVYA